MLSQENAAHGVNAAERMAAAANPRSGHECAQGSRREARCCREDRGVRSRAASRRVHSHDAACKVNEGASITVGANAQS